MKKCPYCAEEIQDEAIKCRHCGEMLGTPPPNRLPTSALPVRQDEGGAPAYNRKPAAGGEMKQGALIGGWVCFVIGALVMYASVWTFIFYGPLFTVAFILAIVSMAQRRILGGVTLLLTCLIVPAVLFFLLSAVRTKDFIDRHPVPAFVPPPRNQPQALQQPPFSRSQPSAVVHPANTPVSHPTAEELQTISKLLADDISSLDAGSIAPILAIALEHLACTPIGFSPSGKYFAYAINLVPPNGTPSQIPNFKTARLVVRDVATLKICDTLDLDRIPYCAGWSPDERALIYFSGNQYDGIAIASLDKKQEIRLPIDLRIPPTPLYWCKDNEVIYEAQRNSPFATIDLDNLTLTVHERDLNLQSVYFQLAEPAGSHPICQVLGTGKFAICNRNESLERGLGENVGAHLARPDLHAIIYVVNDTLYIMYPGRTAPSQRRWKIALDKAKALNEMQAKQYIELHATGAHFYAQVYAPNINPLNGNVVGPNKAEERGAVEILDWELGYAVIADTQAFQRIKPGDIVADFHSDQDVRIGNWSFFAGLWFPIQNLSSGYESDERQKLQDATASGKSYTGKILEGLAEGAVKGGE